MNCNCCGSTEGNVDSHVISRFIRMAITGMVGTSGVKFRFQWCGRKDLPRQDLPKPKLLCESCDNDFGVRIEKPASKILLPTGDISEVCNWECLPYIQREMPFLVGGHSFKVGEYQIDDDDDDFALRRFSVLTAWRALHAMREEGNSEVNRFLDSEDGQRLQSETVDFLGRPEASGYMHFPYLATLYLLGPYSAAAISGSDDEVPFAWAFIQSKGQSGVAVLLGFWAIIWPLLPDGDPRRNSIELQRGTFVDWHAQVVRQLRLSTE